MLTYSHFFYSALAMNRKIQMAWVFATMTDDNSFYGKVMYGYLFEYIYG